jgi:hypothetical protein
VDIFDFNALVGRFVVSPPPPTTPTIPAQLTPSPTPIASGTTYFIAATGGSDSNTGLTATSPWSSFDHAWSVLQPGDTLLLKDGTYTAPSAGSGNTAIIYPTINGQAGKPITLKAQNDGQAIIDGQNYTYHTVVIGKIWDNIPGYTRASVNPYGNYVTVEGLVAKNSAADVFEIYSRNVTLRRNSGYNANPHDNFHVFTVWSLGTPANPANILLEDNVAAGSGRKMIIDYDTYVNVVFRRNFAAWQWWLGDQFCSGYWPQSQGIENYPAAYQDQPQVNLNELRENNISFGLAPDGGSSFSPNPGFRVGNKMLGEIALGGGMKWDQTQQQFITPYYNESTCQYNGTDSNHQKPCNSDVRCISVSSELGTGVAYALFSSPSLANNLIQDLFSAHHGDLGFIAGPWGNNYGTTANNQLISSTFVHNGSATYSPHKNIDTYLSSLTLFATVQNLKIGQLSGGSNPSPGEGAKLQYRYVNGSLTTEPLWPWPMEERIKTEFANPDLFQADGVAGRIWSNFSVTNSVCKNILVPDGAAPTSACP